MRGRKVYQRYLDGEAFKSISDLKLRDIPVLSPKDLTGDSPEVEEMVSKHSKLLWRFRWRFAAETKENPP